MLGYGAGSLPFAPPVRSSPDAQKTHPMLRILIGLIGGIVATGPMTMLMVLLHRRLPAKHRYPLPPREITMKVARQAGIAGKLDPSARSAATLLLHFGYGSAAGGIYGAGAERLPGTPALKGIGFGLLIWTASYLGLLPATGVLTPATRHPTSRNLVMILAHILWGLTLGLFVDVLRREQREYLDAPLSTSPVPHRDAH